MRMACISAAAALVASEASAAFPYPRRTLLLRKVPRRWPMRGCWWRSRSIFRAAPPTAAAAASEAGMGILSVAVVTPLAFSVPASAAAPGPSSAAPPAAVAAASALALPICQSVFRCR